MIEAEALTVRAPGGRALLREVSLGVAPGEVMAVVGPNGAGKSTLLRALTGELRPAAGRAAFAGRALRDWPPRALAQRRAVVSQRVALAFPLTVVEVVAIGRLPWLGTPEAARDEAAIGAALRRAGVAALAGRSYATLSGGEQQRVQLARALAQLDGAPPPAALLLDEPTASLDAGHRAALLGLLRDLAAAGTAVLVVLHDLNEAGFVADRVAVLQAGGCVGLGPPSEVLDPGLLRRVYGLPFRRLVDGALLPDFAAARSAAP
ncbi:heme ABC transporter ATP-binding protein [Roseicella frigidaeris]|uniref:Heme ABC transporter ATP-binding protein n=1 Tax=Roseicella frigidaeris TaxID=2230885 RepID=A0A327MBW8_9PROT|nr:heme ABC transporter ATP-binding protein [Roseicella frigidaeris]RAI60731.1 heme ABC transporter ATP-binding protein [Roseicella frigidaeris]